MTMRTVFLRPTHSAQQTWQPNTFVGSVCYPCRCLIPLVSACFRQLNTLNLCLLGGWMSEKWHTVIGWLSASITAVWIGLKEDSLRSKWISKKWIILQVITDSTSSDRLAVTKTLFFTNTHPLPQGKQTPKRRESKPLRKCEPALFVVLKVSVPQRSIMSVHNRNQRVHNSKTKVHEAPKLEWNTMHYCIVVIHYHCANSKVKHQKEISQAQGDQEIWCLRKQTYWHG